MPAAELGRLLQQRWAIHAAKNELANSQEKELESEKIRSQAADTLAQIREEAEKAKLEQAEREIERNKISQANAAIVNQYDVEEWTDEEEEPIADTAAIGQDVIVR